MTFYTNCAPSLLMLDIDLGLRTPRITVPHFADVRLWYTAIQSCRALTKASRIHMPDKPRNRRLEIGSRIESSLVRDTTSRQLNDCNFPDRSAEPGSLGLSIAIEDRDELIAAAPDVYYVTEHYVGYPCVLVRMSRINEDVLHDLLGMAYKFVTRKKRRK